jgi:hypothetical protein
LARDVACDFAHDVAPYFLTLVILPKVAKANTISVAVAGIITGVIALAFANVNTT